jgi:hypothetical protein
MEKDKKIPVYLTGNGGQSFHDMQQGDVKKLEKILDEGSNNKTFKFTDGKTKNKVIVVLDKLFVMEIGSGKG